MQVKYCEVEMLCTNCGSQMAGDVEYSKRQDFIKSKEKCGKCGANITNLTVKEYNVTRYVCSECNKQPVCKLVEGMYDFLKILHSDSVCVGIGELAFQERIDERFLDLLGEVCKYKSGKDLVK